MMDKVYSKESFMFMLEEVYEELESLNQMFIQESKKSLETVENHMNKLEDIEASLDRMENKVNIELINKKQVAPNYHKKLALHLNLAK